MTHIDMKAWAASLRALNTPPAIPIMTHPGIDFIGANVLQAVTDGEIHAKAVCALNDRFPQVAATTVIMDLTVEAEAFGCEVRFSEHEVPTVIGRLLETYDDVERLTIPDLTTKRIPQYLLANKRVVETINGAKPVLAGCIGPYSLAGRLFEMTEWMMACYIEPELAELLLRKTTDFLITYLKALKETGANGVVIAEPAAGLMSNDGCMEFSSRYVKEMVEAVQDNHFMVVLHNCGNTGHCTAAMTSVGAMGYHFGNKINMGDVLRESPSDALVMGNLDPVGLFKNSSPTEVKAAVKALLDEAKAYPNFVISSGCDVPPAVPLENIEAFYQALNEQ